MIRFYFLSWLPDEHHLLPPWLLCSIHMAPVADPFTWRYRHHPRRPDRLDMEAMAAAAALFVGRHNFSNFRNVSPDGARKNPVRTVTRCELVAIDQGVRLEVAGSGFLYRQVRNMAGALLAVGRRTLAPEQIAHLLATGGPDATPTQRHAPRGWDVAEAKGLCLMSVSYHCPSVSEPHCPSVAEPHLL